MIRQRMRKRLSFSSNKDTVKSNILTTNVTVQTVVFPLLDYYYYYYYYYYYSLKVFHADVNCWDFTGI